MQKTELDRRNKELETELVQRIKELETIIGESKAAEIDEKVLLFRFINISLIDDDFSR